MEVGEPHGPAARVCHQSRIMTSSMLARLRCSWSAASRRAALMSGARRTVRVSVFCDRIWRSQSRGCRLYCADATTGVRARPVKCIMSITLASRRDNSGKLAQGCSAFRARRRFSTVEPVTREFGTTAAKKLRGRIPGGSDPHHPLPWSNPVQKRKRPSTRLGHFATQLNPVFSESPQISGLD